MNFPNNPIVLGLFRFFSWLWQSKGVWLRGLFCLVVGMSFLSMDLSGRFDERFQIRNQQETDSNIVLVQLTTSGWSQLSNDFVFEKTSLYSNLTDNSYWDTGIWHKFLNVLLQDNPQKVGVTFLFDGPSDPSTISNDQIQSFVDPRVTWAASLDKEKRPQLPSFVNPVNQKPSLVVYNIYDDGITRSYPHSLFPIPHMSEVLANSKNPSYKNYIMEKFGNNLVVNYMGPPGTFPTVNFKQVVDGKVPKGFFKDKLVIVGHKSDRNHQFYTPVGYMSRAELMANSVDNLANNKLISSLDSYWYNFGLLFLLIINIWVLLTYPQSIAVVLLFGTGLGVSALSFWLFDTFYIWSPILAPIAQIATTFVIFTTRQLSIKENANWRLQEEKRVLTEVKNLKDNFVSLISHDLKTPIAKIQGIVDRLLVKDIDTELKQDLNSLRQESQELNRYIQSILKVMRVESSDFRVNREPGDLNKLIEAVSRQVTTLAKHKNISLNQELDPLFLIDMDSILMQEVILNLVENAIKYTPEGGSIKVSSTEVDDQAIVVVEDSGVGIDKQEQKKIFEKFHRGEEHSLNTKGSGLGLYLVKYFIELHGGEVFIESEKGQGTTVGFTLPIS